MNRGIHIRNTHTTDTIPYLCKFLCRLDVLLCSRKKSSIGIPMSTGCVTEFAQKVKCLIRRPHGSLLPLAWGRTMWWHGEPGYNNCTHIWAQLLAFLYFPIVYYIWIIFPVRGVFKSMKLGIWSILSTQFMLSATKTHKYKNKNRRRDPNLKKYYLEGLEILHNLQQYLGVWGVD